MPNFNIVKEVDIDNTFRVAHIMSDYDTKPEHANEHFQGEIIYPEKWQIGLIYGGSGTGKSTIAKELYTNDYIKQFEYTHKSVVDDMPKNASMSDIEKMFFTVGFGSIPSWFKPYSVLSNGEKMRVDLARAMLEKDFIVFDEFTSVVDRQVAQTSCIAIEKAIRKTNKQFIAVTCHDDVLNWLQPDWAFNTDKNEMVFQSAHESKKNLQLEDVGEMNGENLADITI